MELKHFGLNVKLRPLKIYDFVSIRPIWVFLLDRSHVCQVLAAWWTRNHQPFLANVDITQPMLEHKLTTRFEMFKDGLSITVSNYISTTAPLLRLQNLTLFFGPCCDFVDLFLELQCERVIMSGTDWAGVGRCKKRHRKQAGVTRGINMKLSSTRDEDIMTPFVNLNVSVWGKNVFVMIVPPCYST